MNDQNQRSVKALNKITGEIENVFVYVLVDNEGWQYTVAAPNQCMAVRYARGDEPDPYEVINEK